MWRVILNHSIFDNMLLFTDFYKSKKIKAWTVFAFIKYMTNQPVPPSTQGTSHSWFRQGAMDRDAANPIQKLRVFTKIAKPAAWWYQPVQRRRGLWPRWEPNPHLPTEPESLVSSMVGRHCRSRHRDHSGHPQAGCGSVPACRREGGRRSYIMWMKLSCLFILSMKLFLIVIEGLVITI